MSGEVLTAKTITANATMRKKSNSQMATLSNRRSFFRVITAFDRLGGLSFQIPRSLYFQNAAELSLVVGFVFFCSNRPVLDDYRGAKGCFA